MNNKIFSIIFIIVLFIGVITIFSTKVCAAGNNLLCAFQNKNSDTIIILKNEADVEKAKNTLLTIPEIKIKKTKYRDKEWSKYVNKYDDLPNMENPFKNEIWIKVNKKADVKEIYDKINKFSFVEKINCDSDTGYAGK